jgi:hypothetical protein
VIALGGRVETDLSYIAHSFEDCEEVAAGVDNDHTAHTELEKERFIEDQGKSMGFNVGNSGLDNKTSQIAHAGKQVVSVASIIGEGTRCHKST